MVWLDDIDEGALNKSIQGIWLAARDGRASQIARPWFGFRVLSPCTAPVTKRTYVPGMQGQVLYCNGDKAFVQARDVFDEKKDFARDWMLRDNIEIGKKPYGTWELEVCHIPKTRSRMTPEELASLSDPRCCHLALAISTFLRTLAKTNPEGLSEVDFRKLGGETGSKAHWVTGRVIDGIHKAGLLGVLNDPQFTIRDLENNALLDCRSREAKLVPGFYFRIYEKEASRHTKDDCLFYVGQSADLRNREQLWREGRGHVQHLQESHTIKMLAICQVDLVFYNDWKYIIEQLFTSLFQSYRSDMAEDRIDEREIRGNSHAKNRLDMEAIATEAAKESGWTGAVQRKSFWSSSYASCDGLNYQSPISESPTFEALVWLRTDSYIPGSGGESIPVSNFTREIPKLMTVTNPTTKTGYSKPSFLVFELNDREDYRFKITRTIEMDEADGQEWPVADTYYDVTFEVRTDWKPHEYSWARLPLIGPFEDWDRANSWAIFISWTDALGRYHKKYMHSTVFHQQVKSDANGSIRPYVRGIETIHFLFREKVKTQHPWLQVPPMATVKVVKHDHVNQKMSFEASGMATYAVTSGNRKHPDVIKREMEGKGPHGDFGIQNIGFADMKAIRAANIVLGRINRSKCDSCIFFAPGRRTTVCTPTTQGACENCLRLYGRPFCSWTPQLSAADPDAASILVRTALYKLTSWPGDETLSPDPAVLEVDDGDDGSEADELDDEQWSVIERAEGAKRAAGEGWLGP